MLRWLRESRIARSCCNHWLYAATSTTEIRGKQCGSTRPRDGKLGRHRSTSRKAGNGCPRAGGFSDRSRIPTGLRDLERIDEEFQKCTGLNTTDTAVLLVAAAMQTLRWVLTPKIGEPYDPSKRLTDKEGDAHVKKIQGCLCRKAQAYRKQPRRMGCGKEEPGTPYETVGRENLDRNH